MNNNITTYLFGILFQYLGFSNQEKTLLEKITPINSNSNNDDCNYIIGNIQKKDYCNMV